jgi:hypothetical protein
VESIRRAAHERSQPDCGTFAGRVEHLGSGRRERFSSGKELVATLLRLLPDAEPGGGNDRLDVDETAEASCGVIRLGAVVIHEHFVIPTVTEDGSTKPSDLGWRLDPARRLRVEFSKPLHVSILLFGEYFDAH